MARRHVDIVDQANFSAHEKSKRPVDGGVVTNSQAIFSDYGSCKDCNYAENRWFQTWQDAQRKLKRKLWFGSNGLQLYKSIILVMDCRSSNDCPALAAVFVNHWRMLRRPSMPRPFVMWVELTRAGEIFEFIMFMRPAGLLFESLQDCLLCAPRV